MITELGKLTMSQYIDMLCGDTSVLLAEGEQADENALADARQRLIFEYCSIADPTESASVLSNKKDRMDQKATLMLFKICADIAALGAYADLRNILTEYGIDVESMTNEQIDAEVERRMKRAKSMYEREKEEETAEQTPEQIRRSYDQQAASLMTYFKFQIDLSTIKATTFAYMVVQADREMKAKQAILARK